MQHLAQEFPHLTGAELISLQEEDKRKDEQEWNERHQETLKWAEDLNTNGGYFRGVFGEDQRFFYKVTDVFMEVDGSLRATVEKLVSFSEETSLRKKDYQDLSKYGLDSYTRVTESEWNEAVKTFKAIRELFPECK